MLRPRSLWFRVQPVTSQQGTLTTTLTTRCCIVGGGPAGMMLGWLLARAGVPVVVLEKHKDFFRDFRGDTLHPSTLELIYELGALDRLLAIKHTEQPQVDLQLLGKVYPGPDLASLPTHCKFVALMPQWDFLEFVRVEASRYPEFTMMMETEATELLRSGNRVTGVVAQQRGQRVEVTADLVVGTDGRHSTVRALAQLPSRDLGAPIDVLWLRVPRKPSDGKQVLGIVGEHHFLVMIDRDDYWQCAFLIEKGGLDALQQRGLPAFRADLRALVPMLGDRVEQIASWDDVKLLTVVVDRLTRWSAPGVLCIGDAAHAMSPVGGVGINLAIQDAVATANRLWRPLTDRTLDAADLAAIQARRERPAAAMQRMQVLIHDHVLAQVLAGRATTRLKLAGLALAHIPQLRRAMARRIGLGYLPEHVESPSYLGRGS